MKKSQLTPDCLADAIAQAYLQTVIANRIDQIKIFESLRFNATDNRTVFLQNNECVLSVSDIPYIIIRYALTSANVSATGRYGEVKGEFLISYRKKCYGVLVTYTRSNTSTLTTLVIARK